MKSSLITSAPYSVTVFVSLTLFLFVTRSVRGFQGNITLKCPPSTSISPCSCYFLASNGFSTIVCSGPKVTQETVAKVIPLIRKFNNLSKNHTVQFSSFHVQQTLLEELDLRPLTQGFFSELVIQSNPKLWSFILSGSHDLVDVEDLNLSHNKLTDQGVQRVFSYLNKTRLENLRLNHNLIVGSGSESEFIKGLSDFATLRRLDLGQNKIRRVGGGQFKNLVNLSHLLLNENPFDEIGEDAFLFGNEASNLELISLQRSSLNDAKFSGKSGVERIRSMNGSGVTLRLDGNEFVTIEEAKWRPFLMANDRRNNIVFDTCRFLEDLSWEPTETPEYKTSPRKSIPKEDPEFNRNPVICDRKLKWLEPPEETFWFQVQGVTCVKDPLIKCPKNPQLRHAVVLTLTSIISFQSRSKLCAWVQFSIQDTLLTEFDLLTLADLSVISLDVTNNVRLSSISFSTSNTSAIAITADLKQLTLQNNSLTDEGVADVLEKLSAFQNLEELTLAYNKITKVKGGLFKNLWNFKGLTLANNKLDQVAEDAFLFHGPTSSRSSMDPKLREYRKNSFGTKPLFLILNGCGLNDSKLNRRSGIERSQNYSGIHLFLWDNEFETVSEDTFRPFLVANSENEVLFNPVGENESRTNEKINPIVCDEKLKWLKNPENRFEYQVHNLIRKNDPGHSVFTTNLM